MGQGATSVWLSLTEIAKRNGVSTVAVHKRVKRFVAGGALSTKPGPRGTRLVNVVAYDRLVKTETDPSQALRNGREPVRSSPPIEEADDTPAEVGSGPGSFSASRAVREGYQAENARLDLEERLNRLADRDETGRLTMEVFRRFRDRILAIPARVADRLAAAPDAGAVRIALTTVLRQELESFAGSLDALEAGADVDASFDDDDFERDAPRGERAPTEA